MIDLILHESHYCWESHMQPITHQNRMRHVWFIVGKPSPQPAIKKRTHDTSKPNQKIDIKNCHQRFSCLAVILLLLNTPIIQFFFCLHSLFFNLIAELQIKNYFSSNLCVTHLKPQRERSRAAVRFSAQLLLFFSSTFWICVFEFIDRCLFSTAIRWEKFEKILFFFAVGFVSNAVVVDLILLFCCVWFQSLSFIVIIVS